LVGFGPNAALCRVAATKKQSAEAKMRIAAPAGDIGMPGTRSVKWKLASKMLANDCFMPELDRVLGKRILLVDDDQGARESIKLLLNIDRHNVLEATNGHEALELFHQSILDLVIIDYFMPQMEGREVAAQIKLSAPYLPILMITAYIEKLVDIDNPVDAVLPKPFGIAELRQAIGRLLNQSGPQSQNLAQNS
jgi:CheY-like chemotaxis protein